jgi:hypothetical protein
VRHKEYQYKAAWNDAEGWRVIPRLVPPAPGEDVGIARKIDHRRRLFRDPPDPADYFPDRGRSGLLRWLDAIEAWAMAIQDAWAGRWDESTPCPLELRWAYEWMVSVRAMREQYQRIADDEEARFLDIDQLALMSANLMRMMVFGYEIEGKRDRLGSTRGGKKTARQHRKDKVPRVEEARSLRDKGLTQEQIATRMGVSTRTIGRYLSSSEKE